MYPVHTETGTAAVAGRTGFHAIVRRQDGMDISHEVIVTGSTGGALGEHLTDQFAIMRDHG